MNGMSGMRIRVKTEELNSIAGEVESQIQAMRQQFEEAGNIIGRCSSYWEGEGQEAYLQAYRSKCEAIESALKNFSNNVINLQTIAGNYSAVEAAVTDLANKLSSDVIV